MSKNIVTAQALSSLNSTGFNGSYQKLGTLTKASLFMRIVNNSAVDITVSYDGVNDHDFVQTLSRFDFNVQSNAGATNFAAFLPQGTNVYVKGSMSTGLVYLASYYQPAS